MRFARGTAGKGAGLLQCLDRLIELSGAVERKPQSPQGQRILGIHRQHALQFPNGFLIASGLEEDPADVGTDQCQRIELAAAFRPGQCFPSPPLGQQPICITGVSGSAARIEFEGLLVFRLCLDPVPLSL
jgi:hypothetical protein